MYGWRLRGRQFFFRYQPTELSAVWLGGSITNGASATDVEVDSWRALTRKWLAQNQTSYAITSVNAGVGGTPSWYALVRLETDVLDHAPALVFVDFAVNDTQDDAVGDRSDGFAPAAEALLRRLWTELPNAMLIVSIFTWPDDYSYMSAGRRAARDKWLALASHYSLTPVRFDSALETLMGEGYDDTDVEAYFAGANNVHPNDAGHNIIYGLMTPKLATITGNAPATLPTRYYAEAEDYEAAPIIRTGTDNDGETGTWATQDTTARQSSTADSTIEWAGTFSSFGLDTNFDTGAGAYAWSLDGGAETQVDLSAQDVANQPLSNFAYGAHTMTLRVVSGTVRVNRFLAI